MRQQQAVTTLYYPRSLPRQSKDFLGYPHSLLEA
jgi:hypothetical protein